MGALPSGVYRYEKNGNATKVDDHPLSEVLIEQPNADMNGLEYREANASNVAMRGNCYSLIERRGNGDVSSLYPLPAAQVQPKNDASTNYETKYGFTDRGKQEWYPAEKIWHAKGVILHGLQGVSPMAYPHEQLALALPVEDVCGRRFREGLAPAPHV